MGLNVNFDDDSIQYIRSLLNGEKIRLQRKLNKIEEIESTILFAEEVKDF